MPVKPGPPGADDERVRSLRTGRPAPPGRVRAAAALLVGLTALAGPASADAGQDSDAAAAAARDAQARAAAAALQVDALTSAYVEASTRARAALVGLADSFSAAAQAEASARTARDGLVAARAERARRVRALYAMGGAPSLAASVLLASSPEDAMWRTTTARRVLTGLVARSARDVAARRDAVATAERAASGTDAVVTAQVSTLDRLQADASAAQQALDAAHTVLASLDEAARRADVAARAAAALEQAEQRARAAQRAATTTVSAAGIPAEYAAAYHAFADRCPGLRWTLLAAVGQVESGHGRNVGPSSAGALGPMQFMPATFGQYAVDGDGDGTLDVMDPQDAVATAARYLCASGIDGTPEGDRRALFAYNRAQWYVDLVLDAEASITAAAGAPARP